eukprot:768482-Hanusia_phi.AAC.3
MGRGSSSIYGGTYDKCNGRKPPDRRSPGRPGPATRHSLVSLSPGCQGSLGSDPVITSVTVRRACRSDEPVTPPNYLPHRGLTESILAVELYYQIRGSSSHLASPGPGLSP